MRRLRAALLVTAGLAISATGLHSQSARSSAREGGRPYLRVFTAREYNAAAQSWAVAQDARGVIYVANNDGVLEYDGSRWRLIPVANRTAAQSLASDATGRVAVGAVGEFGVLEPDTSGQMRYVSWSARLPAADRAFGLVTRTHITARGILFGADRRIFLVGKTVRVWKTQTRFTRAFVAGDRIFVGESGRGLMELVGDEWRLVPGGERFADDAVYSLFPGDDDGSFFVLTRRQACQRFDGRAFVPFPTEIDSIITRDDLYGGGRLADGRIAVTTLQSGLYVLDARGRLQMHLDATTGLPSNKAYGVFQDRQRGVWIPGIRGLVRAELGSPLSFLRVEDATVLNVRRDGHGLHLAVSDGLVRLVRQPNGSAELVHVPTIMGQTWDMLDAGPSLLVANAKGVYEVTGGTARLMFPVNQAMTLLRSRRDPSRVFVGLSSGLASMRWKNGRWGGEGVVPGVTGQVRTLYEAADGRLWVTTYYTGVTRVRFDTGAAAGAPAIEQFSTGNGLPDVRTTRVFELDGAPIFTTRRGIYRFDEATGRFVPDRRFASLFPEGPRYIEYLAHDPRGRIWMSTVDEARGTREVGAAVARTDGSYRWDAQPLAALRDQTIEAIYGDADGVMWFAGPDGLVRFDPSVVKDYDQAFDVLLRRVASSKHQLPLGNAAMPVVAYEDNALRFEFAATSYDGTAPNQFQVRLDGQDTEWSPWSTETYRDYTGLREGSYRFRVRARNLYDVVSKEGTYAFRVLPPWYRTWWAYLGYLLLAGLAIFALVEWRLKRLARETRHLTELVEERTRELVEAREQADAANLAKSSFLATMSHEIRTPLNGVIAMAEMLTLRPLAPDDLDSVKTIQRSAQHLMSVINDILDFSKIEAGKLELEMTDMSLRQVADDVLVSLRPIASSRDVRLSVEVAPEVPPLVVGDATRVRQIIMNLAGNAIKFSCGRPDVRGEATIRIALASGDPLRVVVRVADNGIGMTEEGISRLFTSFAQAEKSTTRRFGGTGLGLAISKRLIELMRGTIEVTSAVGAGSVFSVSIPFDESTMPPEAVSPTPGAPAAALPPMRTQPLTVAEARALGRLILVAEDDHTNQKVILRQLGLVGYAAEVADDGAAALQMWRAGRYALLLTDLHMPHLDGYELAAAIRQEEPPGVHMPILALTANAVRGEAEHATAAGMDGYLTKPVPLAVLHETLDQWITPVPSAADSPR